MKRVVKGIGVKETNRWAIFSFIITLPISAFEVGQTLHKVGIDSSNKYIHESNEFFQESPIGGVCNSKYFYYLNIFYIFVYK